MAQIPIFSPDVANDDAYLRPARIGPMQTHQPLPEAIEKGAGQMQEAIQTLKQQQVHSQIAGVQAAYDQQMATAKVKMLQTPYTDQQSWEAQATSMVDPTNILKASGLPAQTQGLVANELKARMTESFWLPMMDMGVQKMKKGIEDNVSSALGLWTNAAATTDSMADAMRHAQDGADLIRTQGKLAGWSDGEINLKTQAFEKGLREASFTHMATTGDGSAQIIQMATSGNDPHWNAMDPEAQHKVFTMATESLTRGYKLMEDQQNAQAANIEQKIIADKNAGRPVAGELEQARAHFPQLERLYQSINGHPFRENIPSAAGVEDMLQHQLDRATSPLQFDSIKDQIHDGIIAGTLNPKVGTQLLGKVADASNAQHNVDETQKRKLLLDMDPDYNSSGGFMASKNMMGIPLGSEYTNAIDYAWEASKHDPVKAKAMASEILDNLISKRTGIPMVKGADGKPTVMPSVNPSAVKNFGTP